MNRIVSWTGLIRPAIEETSAGGASAVGKEAVCPIVRGLAVGRTDRIVRRGCPTSPCRFAQPGECGSIAVFLRMSQVFVDGSREMRPGKKGRSVTRVLVAVAAGAVTVVTIFILGQHAALADVFWGLAGR